MAKLKRTGETALSDDELVIFDALFDGDCSFSMLTKDNVREQGQLPYNHSLNDADLRESLNQLVENGLLRTFVYAYADDMEDSQYFGLTKKGGQLWEQERQPNWERYIYVQQYEEDDMLIWSVESASLAAAQGYMEVAKQAGLGAPEDLTLVRKPNHQFLPWKNFPLIFELYGEATEELDANLPLKWWRNIPELIQK